MVQLPGALEVMVLCSYTSIFSWRDTKQKSNDREVLKGFYKSKGYFISAQMCHATFKRSRLEMCKEKSKAGADFGDWCGQHKQFQYEGSKLSSEQKENPMRNR